MKKLNKKLNVKDNNTVEMYFSCVHHCISSCLVDYEYTSNRNEYYVSYGESTEHNWG